MNILARQLAENLRAYRAKHLLSKEKLGERVGKHRTYIGRIESADENLTLSSVAGLARLLGVPVAPLLLDGDLLGAGRVDRVDGAGAGVDRGVGAPASRARRDRDTNVLAQQLAENLRGLRAERGLSQEQLAEQIGQARAYVARIETEQNVSLGKVVALAAQLGVHPAELLDGPIARGDAG